jgi:hypothetical protein
MHTRPNVLKHDLLHTWLQMLLTETDAPAGRYIVIQGFQYWPGYMPKSAEQAHGLCGLNPFAHLAVFRIGDKFPYRFTRLTMPYASGVDPCPVALTRFEAQMRQVYGEGVAIKTMAITNVDSPNDMMKGQGLQLVWTGRTDEDWNPDAAAKFIRGSSPQKEADLAQYTAWKSAQATGPAANEQKRQAVTENQVHHFQVCTGGDPGNGSTRRFAEAVLWANWDATTCVSESMTGGPTICGNGSTLHFYTSDEAAMRRVYAGVTKGREFSCYRDALQAAPSYAETKKRKMEPW